MLGVTQAELNKKLRSWSNYSATAKNISERINAGVAEENRWTGIENSSYISKARVSNEDIERLVASVEGDSKGYERKYIARVMLAADTHIDYSGLKIKFASQQQVIADHGRGDRVLGFYDDTNRLIEVSHDRPNTVAHEMGHYIDALWGRDLVGSTSSHLFLTHGVNADIVRERYGEPGVQFLNNFKLFINSLSDVNQTYNSYYNDRKEIFARFFARFIEWTDNIATAISIIATRVQCTAINSLKLSMLSLQDFCRKRLCLMVVLILLKEQINIPIVIQHPSMASRFGVVA
jgi:hypothetical protein